MQLLLGLLFFSILLTTGSSLKCVQCLAINGYCSDVKEECPNGTQVCMSLVLKREVDKVQTIMKVCSLKEMCKKYEDGIGKEFPHRIECVSPGAIIKDVTCSKAPPSFVSFFPAFLGLLLMKLLF